MATQKRQLKSLSSAETATLLREIADSLEGKNSGIAPASLYPVVCCQFKYLGIEIKKKDDTHFQFKIRSKAPNRSAEPSHSGAEFCEKTKQDEKPKYKKLKKQMKNEFRKIHESLSLNTFPDGDLIDSFIKNSNIMISFKNHGDTYYKPYQSACRRFFAAIEAQDLLEAKAAYRELNQIKADCHRKFK